MKRATRAGGWMGSIRWAAAAVVLMLAVSGAPASEVGDILTDQVQKLTYGHYMEDLLYTWLGDDRGFGPEHDPARTNIYNELLSFGLDVELDPFIYNSNTYYNVIGTLYGSLYPDEYYIVCAHYDSVNNPGADDNASGTAVVMESARVVAPHSPEYTIKFILWDREEQGLRGSGAYAAAHSSDTILGVINFDMIGHNNHTSGPYEIEIYGRNSSSPIMNDLTDAVSAYCSMMTSSFVFTNSALSDHASFASRGFQACSSIEWDYFLNTRYHTPYDAIDIEPNYIDYTMTTQVCRAAVGYLVDHANVTLVAVDGDLDFDGDVDLSDFVTFAGCFGGAGVTIPPAGCDPWDFANADFNEDNDVDLGDFITFAENFSG